VLSLAQLVVGNRLHVKRYRGEDKDLAGTIAKVRDTHVDPPGPSSYRSNVINRSRFLVYLDLDSPAQGEPKTQAFYHAFAEAA
jgi:hypothetical protein